MLYCNHNFLLLVDTDPRLIIAAYLSDPTVITKNKQEATLQDSIRVFIEMKQQQIVDPLRPNPTQEVYHALQERFRDLCKKREFLKCQRKRSSAKAN